MKANVLKRVLFAKVTVFVGLAMVVAVVLGAASTAQAHVGDVLMFHLNHSNLVSNALTKLEGSVAGPILTIDNNRPTEEFVDATTALNLQVEPGVAPMKVNSRTKVNNLNADLFDGQDSSQFVQTSSNSFLRSNTYVVAPEPSFGTGTGSLRRLEAHCRSGDLPLGGGVANVDPGTHLLSTFPEMRFSPPGWVVSIQNNSTLDAASAVVLCADQ